MSIPVPLEIVSATQERLTNDTPTPTMLDEAQRAVYQLLKSSYYPKFLENDLYHRCLFTIRFEKDNGAEIEIPTEETLECEAASSEASVLTPEQADDRKIAVPHAQTLSPISLFFTPFLTLSPPFQCF